MKHTGELTDRQECLSPGRNSDPSCAIRTKNRSKEQAGNHLPDSGSSTLCATGSASARPVPNAHWQSQWHTRSESGSYSWPVPESSPIPPFPRRPSIRRAGVRGRAAGVRVGLGYGGRTRGCLHWAWAGRPGLRRHCAGGEPECRTARRGRNGHWRRLAWVSSPSLGLCVTPGRHSAAMAADPPACTLSGGPAGRLYPLPEIKQGVRRSPARAARRTS